MSTAVSAPQAAVIGDDDVAYACGLVRRICTQAGPGMPGTPQEAVRAEILRGELIEHAGAASSTTSPPTARDWLDREAVRHVLALACEWIEGGSP